MPNLSSKYFLLLFRTMGAMLFILPALTLKAQKNHYIVVDSIVVEGNRQSERFVIEKELLFKLDSIYASKDLDEMGLMSESLLMNTNLFITAEVKWEEYQPKHVVITAKVREKWYKWPIPIFELADRNYNQWAQKDYDFRRTNYGLYFNLYNFRGRNETIKLTFINGYTRNYRISYSIPFLDKSGKYGLSFSTSFRQNKEIWYLTRDNKLQFYKNFENTIIQRFESSAALNIRRNNFSTEWWEIQYKNVQVNDTVHSDTLNPYYLLGKDKQNEFHVRHILHYERRDNRYYPLKGFYVRNELSVGTISGDTNSIELIRESIEAGGYKRLYNRLYLSAFFKAYISTQPLPFIPYNNYKAFGYGDYVRGYEQYVVDGHSFLLSKLNLKYALIHQYMLKTPFKLNRQRLIIPFGVYLNTYCDWGKAFNKQWESTPYNSRNTLINADLVGYGYGIDFLFINDNAIRLEYSYNILGDKNFNLHFKKPF